MLHDALTRMPHQGEMRLIAKILSAGPDEIRCVGRPYAAADYPLRRKGTLHGVALAELGAQAAAAHASLFGIGKAHMGLVMSFSDLEIHQQVIKGTEPPMVTAERTDVLDAAASYRFTVTVADAPVVSGDVLLSIVGRTT